MKINCWRRTHCPEPMPQPHAVAESNPSDLSSRLVPPCYVIEVRVRPFRYA